MKIFNNFVLRNQPIICQSNEEIKKSIKAKWGWTDTQIGNLNSDDIDFIQQCQEKGIMDQAKLLFDVGQNAGQTQGADNADDLEEYR